MENRTLLSTVQASMQTFYLADSTANFIAAGGGPAVFQGTTTNVSDAVNYSDADWVSGSFALGNFGSVQFQTSAAGSQNHDYFLSVVPVVAGVSLSGLSATIYGTDGLDRPIAAPIQLPDPNGSIIPTQFYAPTSPNDGSSSLDPSVLIGQLQNVESVFRVYRDLEDQLANDVATDKDELKSEAFEGAVDAGYAHFVVAFAEALEDPLAPVALGVELFHTAEYVGELAGQALGLAYFQSTLSNQVQQSAQQLISVNAVTEELAAKTFLPTRIVVTGTSDDVGLGVTDIGGPLQHYRNDFVNLGGGHTVGTSVFSDSQGGVIASGPIDTQNFDGNLYAESTITLSQGSVYRYAAHTGPTTVVNGPDGSYLNTPTQFQFSPEADSNGSFPQGLTGFTTTGNVTMTTAPDGSQAALITEDPTSSLTTSASIPDTDVPLLVMDMRWLGDFDPNEDASFCVDFIDSNQVSTSIYQALAATPLLHSDQLVSFVVPIPAALRGETGVIQFTLNPSASDGISSSVMLGGFGFFGLPAGAVPANTTASILSDSGLPTYGDALTLAATVSAPFPDLGTPTGTVQFLIDGTVFGSPVPLIDGISTSDRIAPLGAGTHTITAIYSGDTTFLASTTDVAQIIAQAPLTVTADTQTTEHFDAVPALTYTIAGFANGDTAGVVNGSASLSTTASSSSPAGHYPITVGAGTLSAANYAFELVSGTLTVQPKILDVRLDYGSKSISLIGLNRDLPFTTISAIDILFSDNVTVSLRQLSLTGVNVPNYNFSGVTYNPSTDDATFTLPSALGVDHLMMALNAVAFAGDPTISANPFGAKFAVLPGDFNGDGVVNSQDMVGVRNEMQGTGDPTLIGWANLDGNGVVDINDYNAVRKWVGKHL